MKYMIVTMIISFLCGSVLLRPGLVSLLSQPLVGPQAKTSMTQDTGDTYEPLLQVAAEKWFGSFVHASGRIAGKTDIVEIRSRITEQIQHVHVRPGQFVNRGELLVSLDTERLIQQRDLAQARLTLAIAQKTQIDNGSSRSQIETADASIRLADAQLQLAQINLDRAQIRAPSAGEILQVNVVRGEITTPGDQSPLVTMVDTSRLFAIAKVNELNALQVKLGQTCEVTSQASDGFFATGRIVEIEPQINSQHAASRWIESPNDVFGRRVRVSLDGKHELPIGLPVEIKVGIPAATRTQ